MGKFRYVHSAAFFPAHGGIGLYVKHGATGSKHLEIVSQANDHIWLRGPDREIYVTGDQHMHGNVRPLDAGFDEFVACSPFFANSFKDWGIDWLMTNYPQHAGKPSPRHCRAGNRNTVQWMADSGGFQLATGRFDYIDPVDVARWYDDNTDLGVVLDIPTAPNDMEQLLRAGRVQRANTAEMRPHVHRARLMNALHGYNLSEYRRYHEVVQEDSLRAICVGATYNGDLINAVIDVVHWIVENAQHYDHVHILGVYNPEVLMSYFWLAQRCGVRLITSDASTQIQSAMGRLYHHQALGDEKMRRLEIGLSKRINTPNLHRELQCRCPVCQALQHTDYLSVLGGALGYFLLMNHNLYAINRYMLLMDEYARTMNFNEYRALAVSQLLGRRNTKARSDGIVALDVVQYTLEHGVAKARQRFAHLLNDNRLFGRQVALPSLVASDGTELTTSSEAWRASAAEVLDRYEAENRVKTKLRRNKQKRKKKVLFNTGRVAAKQLKRRKRRE